MEISLKTLFLLGSVLLTGLSAGFFYAWSVSVIPGTQKVADNIYLETMQSINRAILNPAFFLVFFGSMACLTISCIYLFDPGKTAFWLLLIASVTYLLGTIGVTGLGNVPLNNQLDVLKLAESGSAQMAEFRKFYESNWNRLHTIRTAFAVVSFLFSLLAIITYSKY